MIEGGAPQRRSLRRVSYVGAAGASGHTAVSVLITVLLVALVAGIVIALSSRARGGLWKSRRSQWFAIGVCLAAILAGMLLILG